MINIDFECKMGHRFEGTFSDYDSFISQMEGMMIRCPVCDNNDVKRVYSGCSIQPRGKQDTNLFARLRQLKSYVENNFEDTGNDFAERARAIHYGVEEKKNIYGRSTPGELKDLIDDGIDIVPLPDIEKMEN